MHSPMFKSAFLSIALTAVTAALLAPGVCAQETPRPEASPEADPTDFDIPVPEGQPVRGIMIPYYGADGTTLQMTVSADVAQRIDDENIEMENMSIDAISDEGAKILVEMPHAVFNMESRTLKGDKGVTIEREDFEIEGNAGEFDVRTRFGKVIGNVKMIILEMEPLE
jgi:hypothetical protein